MGHGPAKLLGNIISELAPGDVLYMINSQEPMVVMFVAQDAVVLNSAEVWNKYRVVRSLGEWEREFPVNWQGFLDATDFTLEFAPFDNTKYVDGMVVVVFSENRGSAKVVTLLGKDDVEEYWLGDDIEQIPYCAADRMVFTGLFYDLEKDDFFDPQNPDDS